MYALPFLIPPAFLLGVILLGRLERWLDKDLAASPDTAPISATLGPPMAPQPAAVVLEPARN